MSTALSVNVTLKQRNQKQPAMTAESSLFISFISLSPAKIEKLYNNGEKRENGKRHDEAWNAPLALWQNHASARGRMAAARQLVMPKSM